MRRTSILWLCCLMLIAVESYSQTSEETPSLGDIARATRTAHQARAAHPSASLSRVEALAQEIGLSDPGDYRDYVQDLFNRREYAELERTANIARSGTRFPGGIWKLVTFYETLAAPIGGDNATATASNDRIAQLKAWTEHDRTSTAAWIALAAGYVSSGDRARGTGWASTVTEEGWRISAANARLADECLEKVAAFGVNDPYYHYLMLSLALTEGWDRNRARAEFERSYSDYPAFYHSVRLYANYLRPIWYGSPGESEKFADDISAQAGSGEGDFLYFEVASLLLCGSCGDSAALPNLSWPKIKSGYESMVHSYGTSNLKLNRYASMAVSYGDKQTAAPIFEEIGDNFDMSVWGGLQHYQEAKNWALH